ncbi:MAG: hypothetical protein B6241_14615 [Spirochaetaceae bacterium 4572_59]|nr:MAG: hypothetical protein B6241_14615 [Spirochaetaceae bacterium 4572_59]
MSLKILIIDDEEEICLTLTEYFEYYGYECRYLCSSGSIEKMLQQYKADVILLDLKMPEWDGFEVIDSLNLSERNIPYIVISGHASISDTVKVMKLGAMNLYPKPVDMDTLLTEIRGLEQKRELKSKGETAHTLPAESYEKILTQNPLMIRVIQMAKDVAGTNAGVLIRGESGTGKELIAVAIHTNSSSKEGPFVKVNCAALMDTLLESEIFGHEKGAFTGAVNRKIGLFEQASGGTLFLDEIGDMSIETQAKMLRILQDKKYTRLGGTTVFKSNCRILAATNKNLEENIHSGRFREDLYYRLSAVTLNLPPLRKRPEDLAILIRYFIRRFNSEYNKNVCDFSEDVWELVYKHSWPGNVRELKNFVQRMVIFTNGKVAEADLLPEQYKTYSIDDIRESSELYDDLLGDAVRKAILDALIVNGGAKGKTAEALGIDRKTLYNRMKKFGLS